MFAVIRRALNCQNRRGRDNILRLRSLTLCVKQFQSLPWPAKAVLKFCRIYRSEQYDCFAPLLEKDVRERLTVVVAHDKGSGPFLGGPRRWEVAFRQRRYLAPLSGRLL